MSLKTLPILFLNMGSEMIYILDQRLQAQQVKQGKAARVLGDIVITMFNKRFLDELFRPQQLYSRRAMRTLFDKLAHASIMRLNTTSMDKLYDLITMAVKYQLQSCAAPKDLLLVTLNHLDGVRKLVQGEGNLQSLIDNAYRLLSEHFFHLNPWELSYYEEARVKVSLLLREKSQLDDGRFVIPRRKVRLTTQNPLPGAIRYYQRGKLVSTDKFNTGSSFAESQVQESLAKTVRPGDRGCTIGTNIYRNSEVDTQGSFAMCTGPRPKDSNVQQELVLLSKLLGSPTGNDSVTSPTPDFVLSFFDTEKAEENYVQQVEEGSSRDVIRIDASRQDRKNVDHILRELSVKGKISDKKTKGDDLLQLMDNL